MPTRHRRTAAALLLALFPLPLAAQTPPDSPAVPETAALPTPAASAPAGDYADLTPGGYLILRLRGAAGGLSPADRIGVIESRLTPLLGVPNIHPSDIVVFLPDPKSHVNRAPVIYALGRRLITVDPATVKAAGGGDALQVATKWAKRLQQVLPRVNWRPPNAPEPKIPANPPLLITHDFAQVGGQTAFVTLRGKTVLKIRGAQQGGLTAAERADLLTARLQRLANQPDATTPDAVKVTPASDGTAQLSLAGTALISVSADDARAEGFANPAQLANSWAKNLRAALPAPAPAIPATPTDATPTPAAPVPTPTGATPPAAPASPVPAAPTTPEAPAAPTTPEAPAAPTTPAAPAVPTPAPATPAAPAANAPATP